MKLNGIYKDISFGFDNTSLVGIDEANQEKLIILAQWNNITNRGTKGNKSGSKARRLRRQKLKRFK